MRSNMVRYAIFAILLNITSICLATTPISSQVEFIAKLYQSFAFEAVLEEPEVPNASFIDQPRPVLLRYLTPKLADLLIRDQKCNETTQEICRLDFLPLWGNQDPAGGRVQVLQGPTAETVSVRLHYPSSTYQITYHVVQTVDGWRIRDITYENGRLSLSKILESEL